MLMSSLMEEIEQLCPKSYAMNWDNVGLLAGRSDKEVRTVLLAVDATSAVVDEAIADKADALITHHPLIFHGVNRASDEDYVGKRLVKLIQNDISYYAMHTNFDVMGMADAAADELNLQNRDVLMVTYEDDISHEGLGRIGQLPEYMTLEELGSGGDQIGLALKAEADVMITGDISHHVGIDAVEKGIAVIDAGHFGIEKIFIPYMKQFLNREAPDIKVIESVQGEPFREV